MGWNWVNDLLAPEGKKKNFNWDARCPYGLCPGNIPLNRSEVIMLGDEPVLLKPKMKFIYKIAPLIYHYQCGYCGCGVNIGVEVPLDDRGVKSVEPGMWGGTPSYGHMGGPKHF